MVLDLVYAYADLADLPEESLQELRESDNRTAKLIEFSKIGLPVPNGVLISTEGIARRTETREIKEDEKNEATESEDGEGTEADTKSATSEDKVPIQPILVEEILAKLDLGTSFGDPQNPSFLVLKADSFEDFDLVGLNKDMIPALISSGIDSSVIWENFARFIIYFNKFVLENDIDELERTMRQYSDEKEIIDEDSLTSEDWEEVVKRLFVVIENSETLKFVSDPFEQLKCAIEHFSKPSTKAIHVMKCSIAPNIIKGSFTTRDPETGEKILTGTFETADKNELPIKQLSEIAPESMEELNEIIKKLESLQKAPQSIQFEIDSGKLSISDFKGLEELSDSAKLQIAVDFAKEGITGPEEALRLTDITHLKQRSSSLDESEASPDKVLFRGTPLTPFAGSGPLAFSSSKVKKYKKRPILLLNECTPQDFFALSYASGLLIKITDIEPVVVRLASLLEIPVIVALEDVKIDFKKQKLKCGEVTITDGETISIDGTTGQIYEGQIALAESQQQDNEQLVQWSEEILNDKIRVLVDAEGSQHPGIYFAEKAFIPERESLIQKVFFPVESAEEAEDDVDEELLEAFTSDFTQFVDTAGSSPAYIRLFDASVNDFLPNIDEIKAEIEEMTERQDQEEDVDEELLRTKQAELAAAEEGREKYPLIGTRGTKLYKKFPILLETQLKAAIEAACSAADRENEPNVYVLIPFVMKEDDVLTLRTQIDKLSIPIFKEHESKPHIKIGAMIENPQAAQNIGGIAKHVDAIVYNIEDLQRISFGFLDLENERVKILRYLALEMLPSNPFKEIDVMGVGKLVSTCNKEAKAANPDIELGILGDHFTDQESASYCVAEKFHFVCCGKETSDLVKISLAKELIK